MTIILLIAARIIRNYRNSLAKKMLRPALYDASTKAFDLVLIEGTRGFKLHEFPMLAHISDITRDQVYAEKCICGKSYDKSEYLLNTRDYMLIAVSHGTYWLKLKYLKSIGFPYILARLILDYV